MRGTLIDSRYSAVGLLGVGGMGEVYLARDELLCRSVALKVLKEEYAGSEEFRRRFRREAENAAALSHPNIVSVYDRGEAEDGTPYIIMEHIGGGTLAEHLAQKGALQPLETTRIAAQVALALSEAHRHGVIHRDIKPHNVFLTGDPLDAVGAVKVGDFGIARAATATTMTETCLILGTVRYLSPEQARGERVGPRSDLYSLGVVFYQMLTGRVPFDADSPVAIAMRHVSEPPPSPIEANPNASEGLAAVTLKLLSKDLDARYPDALALVEDLERVERGLEPLAVRGGYSPHSDAETQALQASATCGENKGSRRIRLRKRLSAAAVAGSLAFILIASVVAATGLYEILWPFREAATTPGTANLPPSPVLEAVPEVPQEAASEKQDVAEKDAKGNTNATAHVLVPSEADESPAFETPPVPQAQEEVEPVVSYATEDATMPREITILPSGAKNGKPAREYSAEKTPSVGSGRYDGVEEELEEKAEQSENAAEEARKEVDRRAKEAKEEAEDLR